MLVQCGVFEVFRVSYIYVVIKLFQGNLNYRVVFVIYRYIYYVFDFGNGFNVIKGNSDRFLNDNQWYNVVIIRDNSNIYSLKVDIKVVIQVINGVKNLDLKGKFCKEVYFFQSIVYN